MSSIQPISILEAEMILQRGQKMKLLSNIIDKHAIQWIGNTKVAVYWSSVAEYARQVVKAFQNPATMAKHCPVPLATQDSPDRFPECRPHDLSHRESAACIWRRSSGDAGGR